MDGTAANRGTPYVWRRRKTGVPPERLVAVLAGAVPAQPLMGDLYITLVISVQTSKTLENARLSWTKSASSVRAGLRLNSSSARQASRASSAAVSASARPLARRVLAQDVEPVGVDGRLLGARGDDHQIAVPGCELLERGEQLLPLRPTLHAAEPLLGLARGQLDAGQPCLRLLSRGRADEPGGVEERRRSVGRVELGIGVGRTGDARATRRGGRGPRDRGGARRDRGGRRTHGRAHAPPSRRDPVRARPGRRAPRAPEAAGTGRAGSARGSSAGSGRARPRRARSPRTAAAPRGPSAARRRRPRSRDARRRSRTRAGRPRRGACAGRGGARAPRRCGSSPRAPRAGRGRVRAGCDAALVAESSAANARAAARLPTPAGPWRR